MNVALLVGRKGSESVPRKNMALVLGRPLAWYPMQAAKEAQRVDRIYCSTDDEELGELAESEGITWIRRPAELATLTARIEGGLRHALEIIGPCNVLSVLACNVGTHDAGILDRTIEVVEEQCSGSCVTGHIDNDRHPWRVKQAWGENGDRLKNWGDVPADASSNRQELPPSVVIDHAIYSIDVSNGLPATGQPPWGFMGNWIRWIENPGCIDVHSRDDLQRTERWILNNQDCYA